MNERYHVSLHVRQAREFPLPNAGLVVPVMTRLFTLLHATKRRHDLDIALAFPEMREGDVQRTSWIGRVVAVWAEERTTLETLVREIELPGSVAPHVDIGRIESLDGDFTGQRRAYVRYRVPSRSSRVEGSRTRRLERSLQLPYFRVGSRSNGQPFSISVLPVDVGSRSEEAKADSYGLSSLKSPVGLPVLDECA